AEAIGRSRRVAPAAYESAQWWRAGRPRPAAGPKLARPEISRIPRPAAPRRPAGPEQYAGVPRPSLRPSERTAGPAPEPAQSGSKRFSPRASRSSADPPGGGRSDRVGMPGAARQKDRDRRKTLLWQTIRKRLRTGSRGHRARQF